MWSQKQPDAGPYRITASRFTAGAWTVPVTVSAAGQDAYNPRIAVDGAGNRAVVWTALGSAENDDLFAARYEAGGWTVPVQLETGLGTVRDPQIDMDADCNAIATWTQPETETGQIVAMSNVYRSDCPVLPPQEPLEPAPVLNKAAFRRGD